jgi:N-acetylneuraminate synthase
VTRVEIVAEAGVNHDGDPARALALVDAAAEAGADAVKFQTFRADALATADMAKAVYQRETTGAGSQRDMLRKLELDEATHARLAARSRERGIEFLSTPFDRESLALLLRLGVARIKIGSGDLTNAPLLWEAARAGKQVILSTGMATLDEIALALGALAHGYAGETPRGRAALAGAAHRLAGHVTLLQCTSAYPAADDDMNLRAIATLAERFGLPVGLSDHSLGTALAPAAVALGATMIEKHLTLDRGSPGPDHRASLEPGEFAAMVRDVRRVAAALGDGVKAPRPAERDVAAVARKRLVAARAIAPGEAFSAENLVAKRAAGGASPFGFWDLVGRKAARAYTADEPVE